MTRREWMLATGVGVSAGAAGLLLEPEKGTSMRMTAVEKLFVKSPGHAGEVAGHAESLLERIQVQPGWRYLDVGCGVGATARSVAETRPLSVVGVDIDPDQIKAARASGSLSNLQFQVMNATGLEFGDEEFDIVATSKTTHHIPSYERALVEMVRVLRPGGYLIYTDLTVPDWLAAVGRRLLPVMGFPSEGALDTFAAEAGLSQVFRSRSFVQLDKIWQKR